MKLIQRIADGGCEHVAPESHHGLGRPGKTPPRIVWVRTPYGWKPA